MFTGVYGVRKDLVFGCNVGCANGVRVLSIFVEAFG